MIKCIIIDDEPLALEILVHLISHYPTLKLVATCGNAMAAFEALHAQTVDLMFLDIKMPGISGLDFIASLKEPPAVIFTTAFAEYAVQGFEHEAVDYLLKPVTFERFERTIRRVLKFIEPEAKKDHTYFKISGRLIKIPHADLLYAQSVKDYIQLHTVNGNHLTHMTMKYLNELLPAEDFLRVHRSYLVNRSAISLMNRHQLQVGNEFIPIGDNYRINLDDFS